MARVGSAQYEPLEELFDTSSGTSNVKTLKPSGGKRAHGVWVTVEGSAARVTFSGITPGVAAPPGLLIPISTPPLFWPFPYGGSSPSVTFASNTASPSTIAALFVI